MKSVSGSVSTVGGNTSASTFPIASLEASTPQLSECRSPEVDCSQTPLAKRPTVDAEAGETEVHETGAAAQQIADLGTAAMLIAVEPLDLIVVVVVDVAARRDRAGATGHPGTSAAGAPNRALPGLPSRTSPLALV
jgi:hypothetical protein